VTREEFLDWAETQEDRYEFDGFQPVAMAPPNVNHNRIVRNIHAALRSRLRGSGCEPFGPEDGLPTVGDIVRRPDAFITCRDIPGNSRVVEGAVIVFEVLSPNNNAIGRIVKAREYLAVPSVHTYIIVGIGLTVLRRNTDNEWRAAMLTADDVLDLHNPDLKICSRALRERPVS
jgi:Uma2 family endonuclease